ncbi:MAG: DegQ family serine endoprotease [Beijerinckiaceae bacterium]|nr:DegQ family serine endoprotease [Beijerinckiaceae bacterium]
MVGLRRDWPRSALLQSLKAVLVAGALALSCATAHVSPATAQDRQAPQSKAEVTLSFAPVVRKIAGSVVNVYGSRRETRARNALFDDPVFREFFGGGPSQERVQQSVGSGVIVSPEGIVVTNHHVIEGMTEVKVALADKREFEADIVLRDPRTDLAVLRIKTSEKLASIEIGDSDQLEVGDIVLAVGNPFGVGQTVTQGIVSALARTQVGISDYQFFIQTDAAINPGNSGGALVDMQGRLVGINTAIFSRSGGNQGIGFAIPANMLKLVVQSARNGVNTVVRPWFGARLQAVGTDVAEGLGLSRPAGALVVSVVGKGPAAEAGIRRGDVITAVDGIEIDDPDAFGYRYATKGTSGKVNLSIVRGGNKMTVSVSLQTAPETPARDLVKLRGNTPFSGASIANISPRVAEEISLTTDLTGVVVTDVEPGTIAYQLGFQKGDIILSVNNETVETTKDMERVLRGRSAYWRVSINRGGQVINTVFGG